MNAKSESASGFAAPPWLRPSFLVSLLLASSALAGAASPDSVQRERLAQVRVPFVENCGQWDQRVVFAAKTGFGSVVVTHDGRLVYSLGSAGSTLTETAISGNPVPRPGPMAVTHVSFFYGDDPARWQSGLPSYEEIGLGEVWRGVSMTLRARGATVEKVFTIQPGASASRIRMKVRGAKKIRIDSDGALVGMTDGREVRFTPPLAYQDRGGTRQPVAAAYVVRGSSYGFRLGPYDHSLPLVVDPILQSTFLGTTADDHAVGIAIDPTSGDVFVAGVSVMTESPIPGTSGGAQSSPSGGLDGFIARFDSTLTTIVQATYLGSPLDDNLQAIVIHPASGDVFVAGSTAWSSFPGTAGGAQSAIGGGTDAFVTRLDSSLTTLIQSTYLGGSGAEWARGLAVDPATGEIVVTGETSSADFPATAGGAQPTISGVDDAFVARLDATLTTLIQATYLGGGGFENTRAMAIRPGDGEVFIVGFTDSTDFPGTSGGAQSAPGGNYDGFVARLNPTLTTLLQATYLGGSGSDIVWSLATHPTSGEVLVAGSTDSIDFPGTAGGAQPAYGGGDLYGGDAFVARLDPTLTTLNQATYLGGTGPDVAYAIAIHPTSGDVLVGGRAGSIDLSGTSGGAQPQLAGGPSDAFVARLDPSLATLFQATYLGGSVPVIVDTSPDSGSDWVTGIAVSPTTGEIVVTGSTYTYDFPDTAGGAQPVWGGSWDFPLLHTDAFVSRLSSDLLAILAPADQSVDPLPNPGDGDFLIEPAEEAPVIPSWKNQSTDPVSASGQASEFTGPLGADYTIVSDTVSYATIAPGTIGIAGGSYRMIVSPPSARPALHWDASYLETLDAAHVRPYRWTLHIGDSFSDVPRSSLFYRFIENVLHHGVTAGCGGDQYCPADSVTRAQMAVFLLKAKHGSAFVPPPCTGVFGDVVCPSPFADWIEQLATEGITGGCGNGNYCPDNPVTRAQMAVFLLKAEHGSSFVPPPCNGMFADVGCPSLFADWIEQLAAEQITGGCGGGNYCPNSPNTRGQMAVFLVKTFGLLLYGP